MVVFVVILAVVILFGPSFWAGRVLKQYNTAEYFSGNGSLSEAIHLEHSGFTIVAFQNYLKNKKTLGPMKLFQQIINKIFILHDLAIMLNLI